MTASTVRWPVQDGDTVWTPRAVAGLIGQRPRLTRNFDAAGPQVRTTVTDARIDGDDVILTLELPDDAGDLAEVMTPPDPAGYGISLHAARPAEGTAVRELLDVALREVSNRGL